MTSLLAALQARLSITLATAVLLPWHAHAQSPGSSALPLVPVVAQTAEDPVLGLTVNQTTFRPGDGLTVGVSVNNPGGGPLADFFVLIRLPDGVTTASIRLGAPPLFGSLARLQSLAPAAAGIDLGGPFAVSRPLFQYTFNGSEPTGTYLVYFAALQSGALANGALDAGELLGVHTRSFVFTTQPGQATVAIDQAAVLLPQIGATRQLTITAKDGSGNPLTGPVTWTSSRPDQVAVDGAGLVRAVVANGSSQITAQVAGIVSAPLLVIATAAAPGATLLTDAQIVGPPVETTPDAPPSADNTLKVVLRGVPPPAVGSLLINTESQPVAGKVVAVSVAGSDTTVTLGLASLPELFPSLVIDEVIDLTNAPLDVAPEITATYDVARTGNTFSFTPKTRANGAAARDAKPQAGTRVLVPFECETDVGLPIQFSAPPVFSVTVNPTLDVLYGPAGLERFLVRAQPQVSFEGGVSLTAAFEGKIGCKVDLFVFRVPVGGPLSMVIGGLVPVGVGFELGGKLTVATLGIGSRVTATTTAAVGVICPTTVCRFHRELLTPTVSYTPTLNAPSIGDARLEPGLSVFAFLKASIGNPLFRSLRIDAFEAKIGGKFLASFAAPVSQMTDTSYRSDYKVSLEASAKAGTDLEGLARMLGLSSLTAVELTVSTDLATSPAPAATSPVTASRPTFTVGDLVTVRVKLDPSTLEFLPGQYNVAQVVLVRGPTLTSILGTVNAAPGQSEFTIPFTASGPGSADQLHAFIVTKLLNAAVFALEIGRATTAVTPVVTASTMAAAVLADLPTRARVNVVGEKLVFEPGQSVAAALDEQVTTNGTTVRAVTSSTATRTVSIAGAGVTITGSFHSDPRLLVQSPQPGTQAFTSAESSQEVCFTLPVPYRAAYSVMSNTQDEPSQKFITQLSLASGGTQRNAVGGDSGSVVLPASAGGPACISFRVSGWACSLDSQGNPLCDKPILQAGTPPGPLTGSYSVTLSPEP